MNKNKLYRLEWKTNDNPNGWIEPTTYCQLKCEGCYRGLAEDNPLRKHEDLNRLKNEVEWFIKNRNVQTISIAGGEPLMYPNLYDLIKYISQKGLKSKIYTNAILLNEEKLSKLKEAGVTEIVVHIDKFQRNATSEELMNNLRDKYCSLFRKIGGVNLGFIMPISKKNKKDLDILADFFKKNSDVINLVVFTVYKEMLPHKSISKELEISMNEVSTQVKNSFGLEYCAYLGKKTSGGVSWLFSLSAYSEGKHLGSFDGDFYRKLQERYYFKKKKYFITVKNKPFNIVKLLPSIFNNSVRKILMNGLFAPNKQLRTQVVLIIDAPTKNGGAWDLCQGCPDAMLHKNILVPSCLLERIKLGEKILND